MAHRTVTEVMTPGVVSVTSDSSVEDAARWMRNDDIGDVVVVEGDVVRGVVTDRDIVVRVVAEGRDPTTTRVEEVCSEPLAVLTRDDSIDTAIRTMREAAVRRLPVIDNAGRPLGMVSLGDLAMDRDPKSALADISGAPPN